MTGQALGHDRVLEKLGAGGTIAATAANPSGTIVTVRLPLASRHDAQRARLGAAEQAMRE